MNVVQYQILSNGSSVSLSREFEFEYVTTEERFTTPDMVYKMMESVYGLSKLNEELIYLAAFSMSCQVIGVFRIRTDLSCYLKTKEIFIRSLLVGATSIILLHNKGIEWGIQASLEVNAKYYKDMCNKLGVHLLDYIVVGSGYTSLCAMGII